MPGLEEQELHVLSLEQEPHGVQLRELILRKSRSSREDICYGHDQLHVLSKYSR